jgi:transcriptional regulator with XRE-family HTH domain
MMWYETFPEWLAARMVDRDLNSARELAGRVGVSSYMAAMWRQGESLPSRDHCRRLADAFDRPLEEVLRAAAY